MVLVHCLKCKQRTDTNGAKIYASKHPKLKGTCARCGTTKVQFVGKGLLFGPNSPFAGIPLIGQLL